MSLQGERATGYGVALLTSLFGKSSCNSLLQMIAPEIDVTERAFNCSETKKQRIE